MKKSPFIAFIAMLLIVVFAFSSCEISIDLNKNDTTETSVETVVVTDEEGSTSIETIVHNIPVEAPVVTIVEVTNDKGKVVATEKVTLSPQEIEDGKNFFDSLGGNKNDNKKESAEDKTDNKGDVNDNKDDIVTNDNTVIGTTSAETTTQLSDKPAPDRVTEPAENGEEIQDDFEVLNSDQFLVEGRVVDANGNTFPYKMARKGNRCTAMSVYDGQKLCFIISYEDVYLIAPEKKTYVKVAKSVVSEEAEDEGVLDEVLTGDGFNLYSGKTKVDTYTEKLYGVKYTVVEYDDGTLDYFNGKTLVKTVASDNSILYYDVISKDVSEGLFLPPADYTEQVFEAQSTTLLNTETEYSNEN